MSKRGCEHLIPRELDLRCESARILIVDDEPLVTRFASATLKRAGFVHVETLNDPFAVLSHIERHPLDLIVLDILMPGKNGLELLQEIRSNANHQDVAVVVLSAADKATKYRSLKLGAIDFIDKPVDPDELELRIRKALRVV
jgi:DNA-binding response OmpR family regulator